MTIFPFNKFDVVERLSKFDETKISFMKIDGTVRDMNASLNREIISDYTFFDENFDPHKDKEDDLIVVYDLDHKDWRSFYLQNLITIEGVEPTYESSNT